MPLPPGECQEQLAPLPHRQWPAVPGPTGPERGRRRMSRMLGACYRRPAPAAWPRPCPAHIDRNGSPVVPLVLHVVPVLVHGMTTVSAPRSPASVRHKPSYAVPPAAPLPPRSCPALAPCVAAVRPGAGYIFVAELSLQAGHAAPLPISIADMCQGTVKGRLTSS